MKPLLIISPHLDDAVLSCGATIAQRVRAGQEVMVATVFTKVATTAVATQTLYAQRQLEDQQALACLGAQYLHLGFTDAPFRNAAYCDFSSLLFHHRLPETEKALLRSVTAALHLLVQQMHPAEIWFPLGVGGHIDHHIVFESSRLLQGAIAYYEELPYSLLNGWNAVRWQQLGATPVTPGAPMPLPYTSLTSYPFAFLQNYIDGETDRVNSMHAYHKEWQDLASIGQLPVCWQLNQLSFCSHPGYCTVQNLQDKCHAIQLYATEWPALFGSAPETIYNTLATQCQHGKYMERRWYKTEQL